MKCQPCGQDNAATALFCTACRRPLVAPTKLPTRIEPLAAPAMAAAAPAMAPAYGGADTGADSVSRNRFAPPNNTGTSGRMGNDSDVLTEEEAWAAVIGDANTHHYLTRFERLAHGDGGGWHWPAFFVTWYWMLYRKMWVPALVYFIAPYVFAVVFGVVAAGSPAVAGVLYLAWAFAWLIGPGMMANGWYYKHCMKKIRDVRARGGSKDQMLARMESAGGTSGVLVVILAFLGIIFVVGILAAVALPAYQTYTLKAKVADAIPVGVDVASAVGAQYAQTGQLPGSSDLDSMVLHAAHHSKYVTAVDLDGTTGKLNLHLELTPQVSGTIRMVPSADNDRHLSWTCTTEDLVKYVPRSCRGDAATAK